MINSLIYFNQAFIDSVVIYNSYPAHKSKILLCSLLLGPLMTVVTEVRLLRTLGLRASHLAISFWNNIGLVCAVLAINRFAPLDLGRTFGRPRAHPGELDLECIHFFCTQ